MKRTTTITFTETEVIHIMDSLRVRINDLRGEAGRCGFEESADLADELEELEHDLFEASARKDDGWGPDAEINAETQMFNAGVEARELLKATSRARAAEAFGESDIRTGSLAALRRQEALKNEACAANMMAGTATSFVEDESE